MLRYFCFLAVILGARSASAPFLTPCKKGDKACIVASAQAMVPILAPGLPELNVPSLDPMLLKVVKSEEAGLRLTLKNTTVTGMKDCTIEDARLDAESLDVVVRCSVVLRGWYKLRGTILVLPIRGEGKDTIKIRDIVISAKAKLATVKGADGQEHWHIKHWEHSFDVRTKTTFDFDNLFDGNKNLSDPVDAIVNANWKLVMLEIAPPIVRAITERVVDAVEAFFAAVPSRELQIA
ncbi:circadian clock-controlled protein daywake-like [Leguminivora glycinivorella]|uniref:circadian clock-controlled protein daywake-like n=1 Tax=Leguminivora glycinivorella TaxID=1035111 RepID=UPI0020101BC1|nr:circadian clock-controlled protein daywake-like [Leguminivora glycinivorella]